MSVKASAEGGVGRIVLDHPPLNILTRAVLTDLRQSLAGLREDASLRVVLLSGAGKHFSAGADVGEHLPPHHTALIPEFLETVSEIEAFPLPVVAAVHGRCLGGGFELVQAADLIVAAEGASFGQPEIRLGVIAPAACALLPLRGVPSAAAEPLFTGDALDAAEALRRGWVSRIVPDEQLQSAATDLCRRIARNSPAALRLTKKALRDGRAGASDALERAGRIYLEEVMATADAVEGLSSFMEKREPQWTGR